MRIPLVDTELGIAAVNHEPAHRRGTLEAANLTLVNRTDQNFLRGSET